VNIYISEYRSVYWKIYNKNNSLLLYLRMKTYVDQQSVYDTFFKIMQEEKIVSQLLLPNLNWTMTVCFCSASEVLMQVVGQVMTRDESSGGWIPLGGGGMSFVSLRAKIASPTVTEYTIFGQRIADQTVLGFIFIYFLCLYQLANYAVLLTRVRSGNFRTEKKYL